LGHSCPRCQQVALEREKNGKRHLDIGRFYLNIVLYGEDNPKAGLIGEIRECDCRQVRRRVCDRDGFESSWGATVGEGALSQGQV